MARIAVMGDEALVKAAAEAGDALPISFASRVGIAQEERRAFAAAVDRLLEADLLLADISEPDAGVGWAVAWFLAKGRLVVLTCRRDARSRAHPLLAGNPSPWQRLVLYDDEEGRRSALLATLNG